VRTDAALAILGNRFLGEALGTYDISTIRSLAFAGAPRRWRVSSVPRYLPLFVCARVCRERHVRWFLGVPITDCGLPYGCSFQATWMPRWRYGHWCAGADHIR